MSKVRIITGVTAWDNARRVALIFILSFTAASPAHSLQYYMRCKITGADSPEN